MFRRTMLAAAVALPAAAQNFPTRPVRIVIPYPPGDGTDTLGWPFADRLRARLGQPIVLENRGGAATNIGMEAGPRAAPAFLPGSAIGLELPPGFEPGSDFVGYEHPVTGEQLRLGQALLTRGQDPRRELRAGVTALLRNAAANWGFVEARRREFTGREGRAAVLVAGRWELAGETGDGWLFVGLGETIMAIVLAIRPGRATQAEQAAMEAMLAGITLRPAPSIAEQLAALPFRYDSSTRLSTRVVTPSAAFLLSETSEARVVLRLQPIAPVAPEGREAAARAALAGGIELPVHSARPGAASAATLAGLPAIRLPFEGERLVTRAPMRGVLWMGFLPDDRALIMFELGPPADFAAAAAEFRIIRETLRLR